MKETIVMVGGPVALGVLIALNQYLGWNASLNYLWATLLIIWGLLGIMQCKKK